MHSLPSRIFHAWLLSLIILSVESALGANFDGALTLKVLDEHSKQPLAVRMELFNSRNRPVRVRPAGAAVLDGYFVFDGAVTLELKRGDYKFSIEAGPEYQTRQGHFRIERHAEDETEIVLSRRVNMRNEGWWAADLDVTQDSENLPLLMRAAGVDFAPLIGETNLQGKCRKLKSTPTGNLTAPAFGRWGSLDFRHGGGQLLFGLEALPAVCDFAAGDSSLKGFDQTNDIETTRVALSPFGWDLPLWIASGKLDAISVIHRHALVDRVVDNEDWGRPRDKKFFPGSLGNGRWSESIYHHLLNCGIRIPCAAGSGSGTNGNPLGTNRVYAWIEGEFSPAAWLEALQAGQVMISNGPLLRTKVEGFPPGEVFLLAPGESREFEIALHLSYYERAAVEYLEILQNGEVVHQIRLNELAKSQGKLPKIKFDESGWFAVRAMTNNTSNYQFASTGPYYVESNSQPRISRRSVQFFLDWLDAADAEFAEDKSHQAEIAVARNFWQQLQVKANAE